MEGSGSNAVERSTAIGFTVSSSLAGRPQHVPKVAIWYNVAYCGVS